MTPAARRRALTALLAFGVVAVLLAGLLATRGGDPSASPVTPSSPSTTSSSTAPTTPVAPSEATPGSAPAPEADPPADPPADPDVFVTEVAPVEAPAPPPAAEPAPEPQPAPVAPAVLEELAAEGRAEVIVDLGLGDTTAWLEPAERTELVAAAVDELLAQVPSGTTSDSRPLDLVGAVALTVDATGLDAVRTSGIATRVDADLEHQPASYDAAERAGVLAAVGVGADGTDRVVAVLDTGVDAGHPYLAEGSGSAVVTEACFTGGTCPNGATQQVGPGAARPCLGPGNCAHGTHVAGIVAGDARAPAPSFPPKDPWEAGGWPSGYGSDAGLLAVQVFTQMPSYITARTSDLVAALGWVESRVEAGVDVAAVNMSLGGALYRPGPSCDLAYPTLKAAIDVLRAKGVATVVSSGNDGESGRTSGPGCISTAIGVGSVEDRGPGSFRLSRFSNHSSDVDLLAPGTSIYSSYPRTSPPVAARTMSGTSMAAPAVAGAFASLDEVAPHASVDDKLAFLQATGVAIADAAPTRPAIRLDAVTTRPWGVTSLATTVADRSVTATWAPPAGGAAVSSYTARLTPGGATCTVAAAAPRTCTWTGLAPGGAYTATVTAHGPTGTGIGSSAGVVVPPEAPDAPTAVSASAGNAQAVVAWSAPATTGGAPITEYTVVANPGGATCTTSGALGCTVPGLANGASYTFTVRATNVAGTSPASAASAPVTPDPTLYAPLPPARLMDTRSGAGIDTVDGRALGQGAIGHGSWRDLEVLDRGGVPAAGVAAVVLNVTAIEPTMPGVLTVYPTGVEQPNASNLNFEAGQTVPNMVIAPVGADGRVRIANLAGRVHVAVDVMGWFPEGPSFEPVVPARLLDSRTDRGLATVDGQYLGTGPASGTRVLSVDVTGRGPVPAADVAAVALNVTITRPTATGFATVYPAGVARPNASNLNFEAGQTVPNMVIAPVGTDGRVQIASPLGAAHVVVDVMGWFPDLPAYTSVVPARLMDTRHGAGIATVDGQLLGGGTLGTGATRVLPVLDRGGVPATGVGAVVLNVTVTEPNAPTFLTVYPTGSDRPLASNVNVEAGQTRPNLVVARLGEGGQVTIANHFGQAHVVVDVLGFLP